MFQRGFKTRCEQTAGALRRQLSIRTDRALCPRLVAETRKIAVITPNELPDLNADTRSRLLGIHADTWSAITIPSEPGLIVVNPTHSIYRQNSDLMHEVAHILLEHVGSEVYIDPKTSLMLRSYDSAQEEEANWLSGCLLLPREALLRVKRLQMRDSDAAQEYGVSSQMLQYRMNVSGVNLQHRRVGERIGQNSK